MKNLEYAFFKNRGSKIYNWGREEVLHTSNHLVTVMIQTKRNGLMFIDLSFVVWITTIIDLSFVGNYFFSHVPLSHAHP